ncbi:MAG: sulfite oxidase [Dehalococcoidia bacterium]
MTQDDLARQIPVVGDGSGSEADPRFHREELQLASRNHAIPLEALRYDITPPGLHYTLIHYDIPQVETTIWRLRVGGEVERPLSLSLDDLMRHPEVRQPITIECAGDGRAYTSPRAISQPWLTGAVGNAEWTGTPLRAVLEEAGPRGSAVDVVFTGLDRGFEGGIEQEYQRALSVADAMAHDVLLAWGMNGQPLPPQHGYPLRLVTPGWYGMAHVKWLGGIEILPTRFAGYQHTAYQYTDDRAKVGQPVERMRVRSLMVPPGIPDFLTRTRIVDRGLVALEGRAWSGEADVAGVEVSVDGGSSWSAADLDGSGGPRAWRRWRFTWTADNLGTYELVCRARDAGGGVQPVEQAWNARGMGNNMAHRVTVIVR